MRDVLLMLLLAAGCGSLWVGGFWTGVKYAAL